MKLFVNKLFFIALCPFFIQINGSNICRLNGYVSYEYKLLSFNKKNVPILKLTGVKYYSDSNKSVSLQRFFSKDTVLRLAKSNRDSLFIDSVSKGVSLEKLNLDINHRIQKKLANHFYSSEKLYISKQTDSVLKIVAKINGYGILSTKEDVLYIISVNVFNTSPTKEIEELIGIKKSVTKKFYVLEEM